jgi:hypothetical protein
MNARPVLLGVALALVSSWSLHAQLITAIPLTVPPASVCAAGALNYGAISSYLNNGNVYKSSVLAPAISASTTYPEFEYYLGQALALDQQQLEFLSACHLGQPPFCQPGTDRLADTTPAEVASLVRAFDADEGLSSIQGFFSIPAPPAKFDPNAALTNFFIITEGGVCLLHPYLVHPIGIIGLKAPKLP